MVNTTVHWLCHKRSLELRLSAEGQPGPEAGYLSTRVLFVFPDQKSLVGHGLPRHMKLLPMTMVHDVAGEDSEEDRIIGLSSTRSTGITAEAGIS